MLCGIGRYLVCAGSLMLLMASRWAWVCAFENPGGRELQPQSFLHMQGGTLYPLFLETDVPSWIEVSGVQTPQLALARSKFLEAMTTGDFHRAIREYQNELAQADHPPWAAEALWHIAEGYHRMRHFHEASGYWAMVVRALPQGYMYRRAASALAESLYQSWRLTEALELFRSLAEALPDRKERAWALFRVGDCLMGLKEQSSAKDFYLRAMALDPKPACIPPESLENAARIFLDEGRGQEAASRLMTALSLHGGHPREASWQLLLARSLKVQGKFKEAALVLMLLLESHPASKEAAVGTLLLGTLAPPCSDTPIWFSSYPSLDEFRNPRLAVYHLDPKDKDTQKCIAELAGCALRSGDAQAAWQILKNLQSGFSQDDLWPEFHRVFWQTATLLLGDAVRSGRPQEAIALFQELSNRSPGTWMDPGVLLDAALAYETMGFFQIGAELYARVRGLGAVTPDSRKAVSGLFRCHLALGRLDDATRVVKEESLADPGWKQGAMSLIAWARASGPEGFQVASRLAWGMEAGSVDSADVLLLSRISKKRGICEIGTKLLASVLGNVQDELQAGDSETLVALGDLFSSCGKLSEALDWYEKAARQEPWGETQKWAAWRIVKLGMEAGIGQRGSAYLNRLLEEPPGTAWRALAEGLRANPASLSAKGGKSS